MPAAETKSAAEPVSPFFALPEFSEPKISPDGRSLAFIAPNAGHACLFKLDRVTSKIEGLFSAGEGEVRYVWWLGNNRVLLAATGTEGYTYFVQETDGSKPRELHVLSHLPLNAIHVLADDQRHVVAIKGGPYEYPGWEDHYAALVDVENDSAKRQDSAKGRDLVLSLEGEIRATTDLDDDNGKWTVRWREPSTKTWHDLRGKGLVPTFSPEAVGRDNRHLVVIAHDQGDTTALMLLDPATSERTLLAQRPDRDVLRVINDPTGHFAVGVEFYSFGAPDIEFFDEASRRLQASIDHALPGTINRVTAVSADNTLQIIVSSGPSVPPTYHLLDRKQGRISGLGQKYPQLIPSKLGRVETFHFKCSDGQMTSGYVVLPPAAGRSSPAPLLLMAPYFAGENADTPNGYEPYEQFLASRGYAVAYIAVHGSRGQGKKFLDAGDFQMAELIPRDLEAGIRCMADKGWIDPARVALYGRSFGGLFALRTAAVSQVYRAVITLNTPGSIFTGNLSWLGTTDAPSSELVERIGGRSKAAQAIHVFEPETFMSKLQAPAQLIYSSYYGLEFDVTEAGKLRDSFRKWKKPYDWAQFDYRGMSYTPEYVYSNRFYTLIADYLDRTLK